MAQDARERDGGHREQNNLHDTHNQLINLLDHPLQLGNAVTKHKNPCPDQQSKNNKLSRTIL